VGLLRARNDTKSQDVIEVKTNVRREIIIKDDKWPCCGFPFLKWGKPIG
jgi:hypothetical protein